MPPRPVALTCRHCELLTPWVALTKDCTWFPPMLQPPAGLKSGYSRQLLVLTPARMTSTSSSRNSPGCRCAIWKLAAVPAPLSMGPVNSKEVHDALADSSLPAQFAASWLLLRGSFSSRLLPPPSAHSPQLSLYWTSSTTTGLMNGSAGFSGRVSASFSPRFDSVPRQLPSVLSALSCG